MEISTPPARLPSGVPAPDTETGPVESRPPAAVSQAVAGYETAAVQTAGHTTSSLSLAARIAASHRVQDLNVSSSSSSFNIQAGSGLQLYTESTFNLHSHTESIQLSFDFSAEALGLPAESFSSSGEPFELSFSFQQRSFQISRQTQTGVYKTLRPAPDIVHDFARAVSDVLRHPGNKAVMYQLDEEARQALSGDREVMELFSQLVMLIGMINLTRDPYQASDKYLIQISGKGSPLIRYQENTQVEEHAIQVQVNIRIHPPQTTQSVEEPPPA